MAGILTHLYIGNEVLNRRNATGKKIRNYFLLGNFIPDAAYWPGENSLLSDLSHYLLAAEIPKLLYDKAPDENWRAFAQGWLLHLYTDLNLHPMINIIAAKYHFGEAHIDQVLNYEMDPQIHALVENGLDRQLLTRIDPAKITFAPPLLKQNFDIANILNELYPVKFENDNIFDLLRKSSTRLKFYFQAAMNLGRNKTMKYSLKSIIKIFRIFLSRSKYLLLSSFIEPYKFDEDIIAQYQLAVENFIEKESSIAEPQWFAADFNFDTGLTSKLGEYDLADKIFADLNKMEHKKSLIWNRFRDQFINHKEF